MLLLNAEIHSADLLLSWMTLPMMINIFGEVTEGSTIWSDFEEVIDKALLGTERKMKRELPGS